VVAFFLMIIPTISKLEFAYKKDNHLVQVWVQFQQKTTAQWKSKFDFNKIPNIWSKYIFTFDHEFTGGSGIYMLNLPTFIQI
jgi:hypothetical protein